MKRIFCIIFAMFIFAFSGCSKNEAESSAPPGDVITSADPSPSPTDEPVYETILIGTVFDIDSKLNIRSSPSTSGNIIGTAKNGDKFVVLTENVVSGWHEIDCNGVTAYVSSSYISIKIEQVEVSPSPDQVSDAEADPVS